MQPSDDPPGPPAGPRLLPPKIFGGALAIAAVLSLLFPMRFLGAGSGRETGATLGWLIILAGAVIAGWAALALKAADTPISPDRPARVLVTGGPYRFSRHPLYLSLALVLLGCGFIGDSLWFFLALPIALLAVGWLSIAPEEAALEQQFGDAYRSYAGSVRRWL